MLSRFRGWISSTIRTVSVLRQGNSVSVVGMVLVMNALRQKRVIDVNVFGVPLKIRTTTPDLYVAIETLGGEFSLLSSLVVKEPIFVVDAGGYIGTASIAISRIFPTAKIVCIEPAKENFELLKQNTLGYPNVIAVNAALVEDGGPSFAELIASPTGEWGFEIEETEVALASSVATVTLRSLMSQFQMERISICKMDIEGAEERLFSGVPLWLETVDVLVIELHERKKPGVTQAFNSAVSGRMTLQLAGEKIMTLSPQFLRDAYPS